MADTLFNDISVYNAELSDRYPYPVVSIRSNDGTYRDQHFAHNLAWAKHAVDTGKLEFFIVYFVFEPNWRQTFQTFKQMVGRPHDKMAVMIDVESWGGKIHGDHSAELNALRRALVGWLRGSRTTLARVLDVVVMRQRKRVIAYGNAGDLVSIWPRRGDIKIGLAAYGSNPPFRNKIFHQFTSRSHADWNGSGSLDLNSADGLTPAQFAGKLGLLSTLEATKAVVRRVRRKR